MLRIDGPRPRANNTKGKPRSYKTASRRSAHEEEGASFDMTERG